MSMEPKHSLNRRSFMQTGALAAVAAGGISCATAGKSKTASILNYNPEMKYRRLGDTDVHLSVISMGGLVMEEPVHHYAIDHGVNLVHISTSYIGGQAIQKLGNVLKTRRSEVYVALKDNFAVGEFAPEKLDEVLSILNTDYVDFFMFNRHKKDEGKDPKIREIFEKYKEMGKVRYAGLTSHGEVKETIGAGIQSGMFDLVNPVLNQPSFEAIQPELQAAREAKIGVMAMKTMKGIEDIDLEIAYLKKVLGNPAVTTVVKGIGDFERFDRYVAACNELLTSAEDAALTRYAQANRTVNCMMCDECRKACPDHVEVSTVLRCKDYYYEQMGDKLTALDTYGDIPAERLGSEACRDCAECEKVCPNGIDIVNRLTSAHSLFAHLA